MILINAKNSDLEKTYRIKTKSIKPYVEKIWGWDENYQHKIHLENFVASEVKLIEYNKQIVGLTIVKESEKEIYLQSILIEKEFQNKGIGKIFMRTLIEKANSEEKKILLQVFKINTKAQKFYKKLGFEKISEMENHFRMEKKCSKPN